MGSEKMKKLISAVLVFGSAMLILVYAASEMKTAGGDIYAAGEDIYMAGAGEKEERDCGEDEKEESEDIGICCAKKLSEEVVLAIKEGDTEPLAGIALGEAFDYERYRSYGKNEYCDKNAERGDNLHYFFDGKGHRFSGFSYIYTALCEPFLGIEAHDPIAIMLEAFGIPDVCEEWDGWGGDGGLRAEWHFERAVLILYERDAEIKGIEYRALGDAADGDGNEEMSDFEERMAQKSEYERTETVYEWELDTEKETISARAGRRDTFVEQFLRDNGFDVPVPDSSFCDEEEEIYGECYVDSKGERYCFILYQDGYAECTVRELGDSKGPEHLVYRRDDTGEVVQETVYDVWGMRKAEAFYRYRENIPFPFLTEGWNLEEGSDDAVSLCRNHKTWFSEKYVEMDESGRAEALNGDGFDGADSKSFFWYRDHFSYRPDGKLDKITEEMPEEYVEQMMREYPEAFAEMDEEYFGEMAFAYGREGILRKIEYRRNDWGYGTWDQVGFIEFDRQGRMVHNHYYVTHGYHKKFYFYHEDEERPRVMADFCVGNGFEEIRVYQPLDDGQG